MMLSDGATYLQCIVSDKVADRIDQQTWSKSMEKFSIITIDSSSFKIQTANSQK